MITYYQIKKRYALYLKIFYNEDIDVEYDAIALEKIKKEIHEQN